MGGISEAEMPLIFRFIDSTNAALQSRTRAIVAALPHVGGGTRCVAAFLAKATPFFEFTATRQESVLRNAIFRTFEFGHCCAIHDTNLGKLVVIAEVLALWLAKQPNPRLLAKNCYGKMKIGQENC